MSDASSPAVHGILKSRSLCLQGARPWHMAPPFYMSEQKLQVLKRQSESVRLRQDELAVDLAQRMARAAFKAVEGRVC